MPPFPDNEPGRGLTEHGAATRHRILDAASRLFDEFGAAGTSLDRILSEAGAGKGQFYHYFQNKEQLVHEVALTRTLDPLRTLGRHLRFYRRWEALQRWMRAAVDEVAEGLRADAPRRALFPLGAAAFEDDGGAGRSVALRVREKLEAHLVTMRDEGLLNPGADVAGLATTVVAAWQGALLLVVAEGDVGPLEQALGHAYALVWAWRTDADPAGRWPFAFSTLDPADEP